MSAPNGHGSEDRGSTFAPLAAPVRFEEPDMAQFPTERVKQIVAALEVPFDPSQIEWRVMNTTKGQQPRRGQVVPYADQRAYTDRRAGVESQGDSRSGDPAESAGAYAGG